MEGIFNIGQSIWIFSGEVRDLWIVWGLRNIVVAEHMFNPISLICHFKAESIYSLFLLKTAMQHNSVLCCVIRLPKTDCIDSSANCSILRQMSWKRSLRSTLHKLPLSPSFLVACQSHISCNDFCFCHLSVSLGENSAIKIIGPITTTPGWMQPTAWERMNGLSCQRMAMEAERERRGERSGGGDETWLIKLEYWGIPINRKCDNIMPRN